MKLQDKINELVASGITSFNEVKKSLTHKVTTYSNQTVQVNKSQDQIDKEVDLKARAIQLVKDLGSNKTDAEIWAILQTLPDKQVNATAKTYIANGADIDIRLSRLASWNEILAVRTEAVEGQEVGLNEEFSSATFGEVYYEQEQTSATVSNSWWEDNASDNVGVTLDRATLTNAIKAAP